MSACEFYWRYMCYWNIRLLLVLFYFYHVGTMWLMLYGTFGPCASMSDTLLKSSWPLVWRQFGPCWTCGGNLTIPFVGHTLFALSVLKGFRVSSLVIRNWTRNWAYLREHPLSDQGYTKKIHPKKKKNSAGSKLFFILKDWIFLVLKYIILFGYGNSNWFRKNYF